MSEYIEGNDCDMFFTGEYQGNANNVDDHSERSYDAWEGDQEEDDQDDEQEKPHYEYDNRMK